MKPTTQLLGAVSAAALIAMSSTPVLAQGTSAGDTITNNVSVSYRVGGVDQTEVTASDTFTVDRKIDVNVQFTGVSPTSVAPGQDDTVLAFDITNLSNDIVDLDLSAVLTSGDGADITNFRIYLDQDGDGVLDASEVTAGEITYLDEVASDDGTGTQTLSVLVVADIELSALNGDTFDVTLTADAHEGGGAGSLGSEITATAGANTSGVDTVLADGAGDTDAANAGDFSDTGDFVVAGANVSVVKSSRIISDPVNNDTAALGYDPDAKAIPGAVIEYCIAVSNASGGADATNVSVADDLPADVAFTENDFGIFVDGSASIDDQGTVTTSDDVATCTGGSDGEGSTATYTAGGGTGGLDLITGALSDISAGTTRSVYFRVTIN